MADAETRLGRLGGSDIPVIWGVHPWKDQWYLAMEKRGAIEPLPPSMRQRAGKAMERFIAELYREITGEEDAEWCDVTKVNPKYPHLCYTPDMLVPRLRKGVDCKLVHYDQRHKWGAYEFPDYILMQCWHYLAMTGYDEWVVAAMIGDELPRLYTVRRDEQVEKALLARAEEWYYRYIAGDEEPPMGGSDATTEYLKRRYPANRTEVREATTKEIAVLTEYAQIRERIDALAPRKDELENRLKAAVGDADGIRSGGLRFTWKKSRDSEEVNWEALARGLMAADQALTDAHADALVKKYTREKPGTRRIRFDCARTGNGVKAA